MKPPIIVNESNRLDQVGPTYVFNTVSGLESYLEPWYVDEPHFIFDSNGMQLEISPSGHRVHLSPREPKEFHPEIVRTYFEVFLTAVATAKGWDHVGVTEHFVKTAPLDQLATEVGKFAIS